MSCSINLASVVIMCIKGMCGVFFSIWAGFLEQVLARVQGRSFKGAFESAYESHEKLCNKNLFPKRAPKVKARKQWESKP